MEDFRFGVTYFGLIFFVLYWLQPLFTFDKKHRQEEAKEIKKEWYTPFVILGIMFLFDVFLYLTGAY